jgi:hypothetical protein
MKLALSASLFFGLVAMVSAATASAAEASNEIIVKRSYSWPKYMGGASIGSADGDAAFSVYGGMGILRGTAIELGYINLGKTKEDAEVTATYIDLLGKMHLSTDFSLYGKIGMGFWRYKPEAGDNDSGAGVTVGLGLDWLMMPSLYIRTGLDHFSMDPDINNTSAAVTKNIEVFSIGIYYSL